jgi:hypothetical protein
VRVLLPGREGAGLMWSQAFFVSIVMVGVRGPHVIEGRYSLAPFFIRRSETRACCIRLLQRFRRRLLRAGDG